MMDRYGSSPLPGLRMGAQHFHNPIRTAGCDRMQTHTGMGCDCFWLLLLCRLLLGCRFFLGSRFCLGSRQLFGNRGNPLLVLKIEAVDWGQSSLVIAIQ